MYYPRTVIENNKPINMGRQLDRMDEAIWRLSNLDGKLLWSAPGTTAVPVAAELCTIPDIEDYQFLLIGLRASTTTASMAYCIMPVINGTRTRCQYLYNNTRDIALEINSDGSGTIKTVAQATSSTSAGIPCMIYGFASSPASAPSAEYIASLEARIAALEARNA